MLTLSACETFTAERYDVSSKNQATLKNYKSSEKFDVGDFSAVNAESISVNCRMAGPIQVPGSGNHEEYIKDALIDELQMAGKYNPESGKQITAILEEVSVSTVTPASWKIAGDFYLNETNLKTVRINYPYKTSFSALGACNNAAENFPYAVEMFLEGFIQSVEFENALK